MQIKHDWARGNKRGDIRLSDQERQRQQQDYAMAEEIKWRIEKLTAKKAELEAKIAEL